MALIHILSTMSGILFMAKITGIFYLSLDKYSGKLQTSDRKRSLAFSAIYFSAYLAVILVAFSTADRSQSQDTGTFYVFIRRAYNVFFCLNTMLQVVVGFCAKPYLAKWLNTLATTDQAMANVGTGLTIDYHNTTKLFARHLLSGGLIFLIKMALYLTAFHKHWSVSLAVALYHIMKTVFKWFFVFLMAHLQVRFERINDGLSGHVPLALERLCRLHFRLCHLARKLNSIASFQFFYSFAVSLGALLFFSYYLYHKVKTASTDQSGYSVKSITMGLFGMTALSDEIIDCLAIIKGCRLLCEAANETPRRLHELRNRLGLKLTVYEEFQIRNHSLQFLHQKLSFTALGYFDIEFSVLSYMAGTVITYLVLFIQYDQSFRK